MTHLGHSSNIPVQAAQLLSASAVNVDPATHALQVFVELPVMDWWPAAHTHCRSAVAVHCTDCVVPLPQTVQATQLPPGPEAKVFPATHAGQAFVALPAIVPYPARQRHARSAVTMHPLVADVPLPQTVHGPQLAPIDGENVDPAMQEAQVLVLVPVSTANPRRHWHVRWAVALHADACDVPVPQLAHVAHVPPAEDENFPDAHAEHVLVDVPCIVSYPAAHWQTLSAVAAHAEDCDAPEPHAVHVAQVPPGAAENFPPAHWEHVRLDVPGYI